MIRDIFDLFVGLIGIISAGALYLIFALGFSALSLAVTLSVIYIFLAMAGFVPPQSYVPFVPYL